MGIHSETETHTDRELAGILSRLELLEDIRELRATVGGTGGIVPVVLSSPEMELLKRQVAGLLKEVGRLAKVVERQQEAIEELSLGDGI